MEAKLFMSRPVASRRLNLHCRHGRSKLLKASAPAVVSVFSNSREESKSLAATGSDKLPTLPAADAGTEYSDNWLERLAIDLLTRNLRSISGKRNLKSGYDGLIEASCMVAGNYCPSDQQRIVSRVLHKTFPQLFLAFTRLLPQSKLFREFYAAFTIVLFSWLVGPCEVKESEFQGKIEKNVVYIKKCRFLEGTKCVGMCVNLCKVPSQKFIKEQLNMPLNMIPNFEDMSCELIFGQDPPAQDADPALKQPCYHGLCKAKKAYNVDCSIAEQDI